MTPAAASQPRRRAAVIVNPVKADVARLRAAVQAVEAEAGWATSLWYETTVEDPGAGAAARALEQHPDLVLAAGGDGTVREVAAAMRGSGIPMALIPQGTGNLLARNLGLPLIDLHEMVRVAFTGRDRPVDVGIARAVAEDGDEQEHVFMVMAGIGLDADMIAGAKPEMKKRFGWLAYVDSGMRAIPKAERFRIAYRFGDEGPYHAHVTSVLVGNCGILPGNITLFPDARIDDGILDTAMLQPRSIFGWIDIYRRVTWENRVLRKFAVGRRLIRITDQAAPTTMVTMRSPGITIDPIVPRMFELDGDEEYVVRSVTTSLDPLALVVRVVPGY